jgi:hypothetical protein
MPGDIRSAAIGALVSALLAYWLVSPSPPRGITIAPGANGFVAPFENLLKRLTLDKDPVTVSFEPTELRRTKVCEYAQLSAETFKEVFLSYIDRTKDCFALIQRHQSHYVVQVRPNGLLQEKGGEYYCKCDL